MAATRLISLHMNKGRTLAKCLKDRTDYEMNPDKTEKGKGRSAENHYPTMKLEDICKLPVKEIAADDSILFMWATFPNLKEAFDVIDAWGFDYKTVAFVWVKQNKKSDSLF